MATKSADEVLHESTVQADSDIRHKNPFDQRRKHIWVFEPPPSEGVLTKDGLSQIEVHQYKSGAYTFLDNLLNPMWASLTELLPMNMAPNLVTFIGCMYCVAAYLVSWSHSPSLTEAVPDWVLIFNAACTALYYTFDCMDGKQARRTKTSSPLGQLFDHGVDCFCLLAHLSTVHLCVLDGGRDSFWATQAALMFPFFVAQWEEYYTGVLPHSTGNVGVTEVNYGQALFSFVNAFVDREALYTNDVVNVMAAGWVGMMTLLTCLSVGRVLSTLPGVGGKLSALSKLASPLMLACSPFLLPQQVRERETRFLHLITGLAMVLCTIKVVVFSMARQAYAALQMDAIPCLLGIVWVRCDARITSDGVGLLFRVLAAYYLGRILFWASAFIRQVCERMNIALFTIKKKHAK